jgi:hypothetical protein
VRFFPRHGSVQLVYNPYFLAYFSAGTVFFSQQISQNSVSAFFQHKRSVCPVRLNLSVHLISYGKIFFFYGKTVSVDLSAAKTISGIAPNEYTNPIRA